MTRPRVGIMQGRLVPPEEGRFQSFPAQRWRDEFALARMAGVCCIEWIYEAPNEDSNPLRSDAGIAALKTLSADTGIGIRSVCADYFMTHRLIGADGVNARAVDRLRWLLGRAALLGMTYIVLPFVDSSSLRTAAERAALVPLMQALAPAAEAAKIELHLESDFSPQDVAAVLRAIGHPRVKANYDIGNSAALGFDPEEELTLLAPWLGSVHVKDRVKGGGTVPLGTGNADFATAFRKIREAGFDRWFILQVARPPHAGDEVSWIKAAREFVEDHMAAVSA